MEKILGDYKKYSGITEIYQIVNTVELVKDRRILRVEILKDYTSSPIRYIARYWEMEHSHIQPSYPQENGKFTRKSEDVSILKVLDGVDVYENTAEFALHQALHFLTSKGG